MISEFKLCKNGTCGITITGLEQDNDSYLSEESTLTSFRTYKWSESTTLNTILTVTANEVEILLKYEFKDHNIYPMDDSTFDMNKDGIYALEHLIIPNKNWLNYILERDVTELEMYDAIIFYDLESGSLKQYIDNNNISDISVNDVINLKNIEKSTVIFGVKNTFNMCHINDCFYKVNKKILENLAKSCKQNSNIIDLSYDRDLIWMTINAIKYAIDTSQLFEALRILESVTTCYTICQDTNNYKFNDCGCNR